VREALRSLAMMNVIELRHGSGTFVTSLEPKLLVENFDLVFSLTDNSFLQLIQAREVIEPGATALAAQHITDDEIAELEDILERSWECLSHKPLNFSPLDIEFHVKTAEFSRNVLLSRIMQAIAQMSIASSQRTASSRRGGVEVGGVERAVRAHQEILDAIKARSPELARECMIRHLESVESTLRGLKADI